MIIMWLLAGILLALALGALLVAAVGWELAVAVMAGLYFGSLAVVLRLADSAPEGDEDGERGAIRREPQPPGAGKRVETRYASRWRDEAADARRNYEEQVEARRGR